MQKPDVSNRAGLFFFRVQGSGFRREGGRQDDHATDGVMTPCDSDCSGMMNQATM
jgi:hypothetical protein